MRPNSASRQARVASFNHLGCSVMRLLALFSTAAVLCQGLSPLIWPRHDSHIVAEGTRVQLRKAVLQQCATVCVTVTAGDGQQQWHDCHVASALMAPDPIMLHPAALAPVYLSGVALVTLAVTCAETLPPHDGWQDAAGTVFDASVVG